MVAGVGGAGSAAAGTGVAGAEVAGAAKLERSLRYWDLVLYGLAYIAPFAPLSTLGFVWSESNGLIVMAYVLGAVCMYFTAQSYATMTETLPTAGSVYGFARHSLGAFPGFVAGWMILLDYLLIPAFLYVLIAVALGSLLPGIDRGVWVVSMVAITTAVNWFGITVTWVLGDLLPGIAIKDQAAAAYELAAWATGPWTAVVLAWAYAGIVGLSNALPMQVGVARVVFAMGRDRQLPTALARVHPRYHTPYMGMLVTAALSLAVALYMKNRLDDLASIVNFGALSGFLFLHVSVLAYFGVKRGSAAWVKHWLVPICGIVVVLAVFSGMSALAVKVGTTWLAVGLVYGLVLKAKHREELHVPL